MKTAQQRQRAKKFVEKWQGKKEQAKHNEVGLKQEFWNTLLRDVYGVKEPENIIQYEMPVGITKGKQNSADAYISPSYTLIEQKAWGKSLDKRTKQSDGFKRNALEQAVFYRGMMATAQPARWIITCNFEEFRLYNCDNFASPTIVKLTDLPDNLDVFSYLATTKDIVQPHSREKITFDVGQIIHDLYSKLSQEYKDPTNPKSIESLNKLMVRLIFLFYAQSAGLLGEDYPLNEYLRRSFDLRADLYRLFSWLDTPYEDRESYVEKSNELLFNMPYINGQLFKEKIEIPAFTPEIKNLLVNKAVEKDYSKIDPTIFGAIFESCLNPETRKTGGMHYTSIDNINKVIDPLFIDELRDELKEIKAVNTERRRKIEKGMMIKSQGYERISKQQLLKQFIEKLSTIRVFDPACGSGNFLTQSYIKLRQIENDALAELYKDNPFNSGLLNDEDFKLIHVNLDQFYGIEIHDFAVAVAKTALWIAESQMFEETRSILNFDESIEFFPLKSNVNIIENNALTTDWDTIVSKQEPLYIIGNPPFYGARQMKPNQKKELKLVFGDTTKTSELDYVTCWFKKAADYIKGTGIRCAFVATNSICQGAQVDPLWRPLLADGVHIDFAYKPFIWDSEATDKASVYCVIVAFSRTENPRPKLIYPEKGDPIKANNISPYLVDGVNVCIPKKNRPVFKMPAIFSGSQPLDNGNLIMTKKEMEAVLKKEPQLQSVIRPYMMGVDLMKNRPRYCFWLNDADPSLLYKSKILKERIQKNFEFRDKSKRTSTYKGRETPALFVYPVECKTDYLAIPVVTSGARNYIPMGFLPSNVIPGNKLICMENPSLYDFGILMSSVHMTWVQTITGRLKEDFSYSIEIVYNNFPWPEPTPEQRQKIEKTAKRILEARALYPDSNLRELYSANVMKPELLKAHKANDRAVLEAYGFKKTASEKEIMRKLLEMYLNQVIKEGEAKLASMVNTFF